MARKVHVIKAELADAVSLAKEMEATVPDPEYGDKAVRGKYPPGVVANVKEKVKSLKAELEEAQNKESPADYTARKIIDFVK